MHTKSHDYRFWHSNNNRDITSTVVEVVMLVLLRRWIHDARHSADLRGMTNHT
jgi:hypothetical protein